MKALEDGYFGGLDDDGYERLQELEEDLHRHIHLENAVLFPKAMQLATAG